VFYSVSVAFLGVTAVTYNNNNIKRVVVIRVTEAFFGYS